MERIEKNWTLIPFCAGALVFALLLCLTRRWGVPAFLGLFCAGFAGLLVLYVLFVGVFALFVDKSRPAAAVSPFHSAMVKLVMGLLCALGRVRIHVSGPEPPAGNWLLVGNHRSGFDPLITGWVLRKRQLAFIAKPPILRLPIVGAFLHRSCFLAIDRDNDRAALKTILEAARLLKEGVTSFGVYPEGTRNTGTGLLPFRNGAFKIAQRAKAPVVAVALRGSGEIGRRFPWRSTDVYLDFCAVLSAEETAALSTQEIGDAVREHILNALG